MKWMPLVGREGRADVGDGDFKSIVRSRPRITQRWISSNYASSVSVPEILTASAEIDRPPYGSSTLQRARMKLSADVQVTHLKQKEERKKVTIQTFLKLCVFIKNRAHVHFLTWWGLTQAVLRLGYRVPGSMVYCSKFLAMFSGVVWGSSR